LKKLMLIMAVSIAISMFSSVSFAYTIVGLNNFRKEQTYDSTFTDIQKTDWYYDNVVSSYEYSIMTGKEAGVFDPKGNITIAEAITVAVRINSIYQYELPPLFELVEGEWYTPYVVYALDSGIIASEYVDYNAPATRAEFAKILANSMDSVEFTEINYVDDGAIPDVPIDSDCAESVYLLYRAGIIAGSDETGTFYPDSTITRAEAAAIITRMIDPSLRRNIELYGEY